ncbi:MAG TPA: hypothetical protein VKE41_23110, partial [Roseiflexaceae bacterium]|nr:hypothetical protein [Roseiflexaceae bacterium]
MLHDPLVGAVCNPEEVWQMTDELLVAQARWHTACYSIVQLVTKGGAMAHTQTRFEALEQLARDLDIGLVSGPLQPPEAGQLYLGNRSLAEILLPTWANRQVALAVAAGAPGREQVLAGTATLNADGLARLERAVHAAGGHVYEGML